MSDAEGRLFPGTHGIIPALDVESTEAVKKIVEATNGIDGVSGYKIGLSSVLRQGLAATVRGLRELTDLPLVYDHQKAGPDVPDMAGKFSRICKESGIDALILFPLAGPGAVTSFVGSAIENQLVPIVGGDLPFDDYNASGGGYVIDDALDRIFDRAVEAGARHFVVPGNTTDKVSRYAERLGAIFAAPTLLIPGIGALGGSITDCFTAAQDCHCHAVIGRAIYAADDPVAAARELADQALRFA